MVKNNHHRYLVKNNHHRSRSTVHRQASLNVRAMSTQNRGVRLTTNPETNEPVHDMYRGSTCPCVDEDSRLASTRTEEYSSLTHRQFFGSRPHQIHPCWLQKSHVSRPGSIHGETINIGGSLGCDETIVAIESGAAGFLDTLHGQWSLHASRRRLAQVPPRPLDVRAPESSWPGELPKGQQWHVHWFSTCSNKTGFGQHM